MRASEHLGTTDTQTSTVPLPAVQLMLRIGFPEPPSYGVVGGVLPAILL